MLSALTIVAALSGDAQAAQHGATSQWNWSEKQRFYLDVDVHLPQIMWFAATYNKQARVDYFELELIADCSPGEVENRRSYLVTCKLEALALRAEGLPQDAKLLGPIVSEMADRMSGTRVQLQVRSDGRLVNIDIEDLDRRNQRFALINENMRLMLSRAFSGLDLPLGPSADEAWVQHDSWLMRAPSPVGSSGSSDIVSRVTAVDGLVWTIQSGGRGIIAPGEGLNKYDARMFASATFDQRSGTLIERVWTVVGGPTASSLIAQGIEGFPYVQRGRIVSLEEGEAWQLGDTGAFAPQGPKPSALQQGQYLGTHPSGRGL